MHSTTQQKDNFLFSSISQNFTGDGLIHNFVRVILLSITVLENGYFGQFSTVKLLRIIKKNNACMITYECISRRVV